MKHKITAYTIKILYKLRVLNKYYTHKQVSNILINLVIDGRLHEAKQLAKELQRVQPLGPMGFDLAWLNNESTTM